MPVKFDIRVNDELKYRVHVGRVRGTGINVDSVNTYSALVQFNTPSATQWDEGVLFTHKYGDGVAVLCELALSSLRREGLLN